MMSPEPGQAGPGGDPAVQAPPAQPPVSQPASGGAPGEKDDPGKEALTTAADFVKYSVALATGTLVFSAGLVLEEIALSTFTKVLIMISWLALATSAVAGVMAFSRIPILLAERNYDLEDRYFIVPGRIHQLSFFAGILTLGLALMLALWSKGEAGAGAAPPSPALISSTQAAPRADTPEPAVSPTPTSSPEGTPLPETPPDSALGSVNGPRRSFGPISFCLTEAVTDGERVPAGRCIY